MSKLITTVAFDMDGTLVDLVDCHFNMLNNALSYYNYPIISQEEQLTKYNGLTTKEKLKMLGYSDSIIESINKIKQEYTINEIDRLDFNNSNIINIMKYLKDNYINIAIATNSINNTVQKIVDKLEIRSYCDLILSNEHINFPKPNPDIYITVAKFFDNQVDEVLAVEDGKYGIEAAIRAGVRLMKVRNSSELTLDNIKEYL